jgi:hypothetical protein
MLNMYDTKSAVKIAFLSHMTLQPTKNDVAPCSPVKCDSLKPVFDATEYNKMLCLHIS